MTLTRNSTLQDVALAVGAQLSRRGIRAVHTGGACVAIYTGTYVSKDADFVIQGNVRQQTLDEALRELGFVRRGDCYVHAETPFFIESPPGPLSIGDDLAIKLVELAAGDTPVLALSATDSCRDRLAAFYHWDDRQALQTPAGHFAGMISGNLRTGASRLSSSPRSSQATWPALERL